MLKRVPIVTICYFIILLVFMLIINFTDLFEALSISIPDTRILNFVRMVPGYLVIYRYITAMFITSSLAAFLITTTNFLFVSLLMERSSINKLQYAFGVLICGIVSELATMLIYHSNSDIIFGFWGAISGIVAMTLGYYKNNTKYKIICLGILVVLIMSSLNTSGMDYIGITAGFVAGYMIGKSKLLDAA